VVVIVDSTAPVVTAVAPLRAPCTNLEQPLLVDVT